MLKGIDRKKLILNRATELMNRVVLVELNDGLDSSYHKDILLKFQVYEKVIERENLLIDK